MYTAQKVHQPFLERVGNFSHYVSKYVVRNTKGEYQRDAKGFIVVYPRLYVAKMVAEYMNKP